MNTQAHIPDCTILGATGLSKGTLAAHLRQAGLFGRDSNLSRAQQAAVYGQLPDIAGLRSPMVNLQPTSQLRAIAALAHAVVTGDGLERAQPLARSEGVREEIVAEICTVVADALLVFGPFSPRVAQKRPELETAVALEAAA